MKVYLYSKAPLTPEQEAEALRDIGIQAKTGFRIEVQREVLAHGAEETYSFLVRRIEPANKFYGAVDGDTVFEIVHDEVKPPPPSAEKCELLVAPPSDKPLLLTETDRLKLLIDDLEAVRAKHGVTYEFLHKMVDVMEDFGWDTRSALGVPPRGSKDS